MSDAQQVLDAANAASPRRTYGCPECGKVAERKSPKGPPPLFCSKPCKMAFFNREAVDGRAIIALAKAWRLSRNNPGDRALGAQCLSQMSSILDLICERDRREGRTTAMTLGYAETKLAGGAYMDRTDAIKAAKEQRAKQEPDESPAAPAPVAPDLAEIMRLIADGHNDPRQLAATALGNVGA